MNNSHLNSLSLNRSLTKTNDQSDDIILGCRSSVQVNVNQTAEDQKPSIKLMSYAQQVILKSKRIGQADSQPRQVKCTHYSQERNNSSMIKQSNIDRYKTLFPKTFSKLQNNSIQPLLPLRLTSAVVSPTSGQKQNPSVKNLAQIVSAQKLNRTPTAVKQLQFNFSQLSMATLPHSDSHREKDDSKKQKPLQSFFVLNKVPNPQQPEEVTQNIRFPNYEVEKFLGKGKFSEVYLARQKESNFRVSLKVIQKDTIRQKGMERQLAWEIKIQNLLKHPNIVRLYTMFQNETEVVLVLEYCADGQLYELLKNHIECKLPEVEAAQYIKQTTQALTFLHGNDVIHRDIKPENILISFGQAKLADFSFCVYSPSESRQTQCGTMIYSSPEQVTGLNYDKKSDMWSLGVLAYELCEGQTPWEDLQRDEAIQMISQGQIKCPNHFSLNLKNFIEQLTKKQPKARMNARQAQYHPWLQQTVQQAKSINFCV